MNTPEGVRHLRNIYETIGRNRRRRPNPPPASQIVYGFNVRQPPNNRSHRRRNVRRSALNMTGVPPQVTSSRRINVNALSKNELQILANSAPNMNMRRMYEKAWIVKTANQNSFKNIRRILNSGAIKSRSTYKMLENAWFNKLVRNGTANNLNSAMKMNTRYAHAIENAWSLRRIPTKNLSRLVNRGLPPPTTRMGQHTYWSMHNELKRRGAK